MTSPQFVKTIINIVVIIVVLGFLLVAAYPTIKKAYDKLKSLKKGDKDDQQDKKG